MWVQRRKEIVGQKEIYHMTLPASTCEESRIKVLRLQQLYC